MKRISIFAMLPILFCSIACNRIPSEYRSFVEMPLSKQHEFMSKMPLDRRIDYYLAGMRYIEPPQIGLADDIAREGKKALPVLVQRVRAENDERAKVNLVLVFGVMHSRFVKLDDERETLTTLRQTVAEMTNQDYRKRSEQTLEYIETDKVPDIETVLTEISKK